MGHACRHTGQLSLCAGVEADAKVHLTINLSLAVAALVLGLGWAWWTGRTVAITAMPQMVALYNGMGGGAAAAIAAVELFGGCGGDSVALVVTLLGALIGSVSLSGSIVAWAKLDGRIQKPWRYRGQNFVNAIVFLGLIGVGAGVVAATGGAILWAIFFLGAIFFVGALALGVMITGPIGGADMPVVISLYNALTGLAVALDGYTLQNPALMIAGMVVGSAGTLLTLLMAKAMNRSSPTCCSAISAMLPSSSRARSRAA